MRDFSRPRNALAACGALTVLAIVFGVVLQATGTPGVVVTQDKAKEEANGLPVLAAGFVTAEGKLTRAGGAKVSVKQEGKRGPFGGGQVEYQVMFAQELSSAPVVVATGDSRYELNVDVTKKGFTVSFSDRKERASRFSSFNFIVVKVSECTP